MSPEIATVLRALLISAGAGLVTKGVVDEATLQTVVGAVLALLTVTWGIYSKQGRSKEAQKVAVKVDTVAPDAVANANIAAETKAAAKQGGYFKFWILPWVMALVVMAACASLGLNAPASNGQRLVQAYGNALAASAMIPDLLAPPPTITKAQARETQDASKSVRETLDAYWDAASLMSCRELLVPAQANSSVAPGAVDACDGPDALKILAIINNSAMILERFVLDHQGGKK